MIRILALAFVLSFATSARADIDFLRIAYETKENLTRRLAECGLEELDARDPRLPFPRTPANLAYADMQRRWLAGYLHREMFGSAVDFTYKRPNGGSVAWMTVRDDSLRFGTARGGTVARMSRYYTPAGEFYNLYCGSYRVNEAQFRACVETQWVRPFLATFCSRG